MAKKKSTHKKKRGARFNGQGSTPPLGPRYDAEVGEREVYMRDRRKIIDAIQQEKDLNDDGRC